MGHPTPNGEDREDIDYLTKEEGVSEGSSWMDAVTVSTMAERIHSGFSTSWLQDGCYHPDITSTFRDDYKDPSLLGSIFKTKLFFF